MMKCPYCKREMEEMTKMNKKSLQLNNMIFPIWLLWLIPITWIIVLPANFLIDLFVIIITLKVMKVEKIKQRAKAIILRVWIFGFIADFIGTVGMFLANIINFNNQTELTRWWNENIANAISYDPFKNIYSILWVSLCIIISGLFIYLFNYKFCLKKADLDERSKRKLALSLAIFTAPYLFLLPTNWFY